MKIVFFDFATFNYGGGCEINFMNLGKWLKNKGYDIFFVSGDDKLNNQCCFLLRQGKHTKNISDKDLKDKFTVEKYLTFGFLDLLLRTKKYHTIKKIIDSADVVYSKNEIFEILIAKYFFKINFSKLVFGFHTPIHYPSTRNFKSKLHNLLYNSSFYFNMINNAKVRYLVLSEKDELLLNKKNKSETVVIPNPLNTAKFNRINYKKKDYYSIYYIGRMTEQKGVDTLALVIKDLSKTEIFKKCKFYFIGNGDQDVFLKNISSKYNNCFFLGFREDVLQYYKDSDLVIVPSRAESFCYTVAEAQSCGVPVLCSDIPGPKDIIIPNITGWTVKVDSVSEFVKGIENSYKIWNENFSTYKKMGELARNNILNNYEEEKINLKIESFLFKK